VESHKSKQDDMVWVECQTCGQRSCILEAGVECLRLIAPGEICHGVMMPDVDEETKDESI